MDEELTLPESLDALTTAELRELHGTFMARIGALREQETLTIAEAKELRRLTADANTIAGTVNEVSIEAPADVELAPEPPAAPVLDTTAEATPVAAAAEGEAPAGTEAPAADGATDVVPATPKAASVTAADLGGLPGSGQAPSEDNHPTARAPFVASAGQQTMRGGSEATIDQLGAMFEDMRRNAMGSRELPQTYVASVNRFAPDAPKLGPTNGAAANTALIHGLPQNPKTAAICGPLDVVRTIPDCVNNGRPVRDMFRQIPAERGAFLFQRSVGLADVEDGVAEWTDADQENVDPNDPTTWKQCLAMVCADPITAEVDAAFRCLTVDVKQEFSNPEQVQNNINTLSAATDRLAEGMLLRKIDTLSGLYTFTGGGLGSIPDLADIIARVVGKGADATRSTDTNPGYMAIIPGGLINRLAVDELSRGFEGRAAVRAQIDEAMAAAGLDGYVITPDPAVGSTDPWDAFVLNPPGGVAVVLPDAPTTWTIRILDPSAGFFFSTGEIAFGMQRSPELARRNQIQWFGETFEGLDKQGCAPWFSIEAELCPNGSRAGMIDPIACA